MGEIFSPPPLVVERLIRAVNAAGACHYPATSLKIPHNYEARSDAPRGEMLEVDHNEEPGTSICGGSHAV
jgi:hypothetical protein